MKLCVIGNSHVAALRDGWSLVCQHHRDVSVTFYAGPARIPQSYQMEDTIITPEHWHLKRFWRITSGLSSKLDVTAFDAFFIHAYIYLPLDLDRRHSEAVRRLAARVAVERQAGWPLARMVRRASPAPIFLGHRPLPLRSGVAEPETLLPYDDLLCLLQSTVEIGGVTLIAQPPDTRTGDRYTCDGFEHGGTEIHPNKDGRGLPKAKPDGQHMNPDFGARVMSGVVAALAMTCR